MNQDSEVFLSWLSQRKAERPKLALGSLAEEEDFAGSVAVVVVDLVNGFCKEGALASPQVGSLVEPIVDFLKRAHQAGIRRFFFPCDSHPADSPEFSAFPPHCVEGTTESELVEEVRNLEFSPIFTRLNKGSVSSMVGTPLAEQLAKVGVRTVVCAGDCTDLCLYHLAVGLRFYANEHQLNWRIVVPQDLVATYDLPVEVAQELGALPHPADLMNDIFLYHLELNGVEVVSTL